MCSTEIVSLLFGNLNETTRRLEKQYMDWESTEESYKLEIERLGNVKGKNAWKLPDEWQEKMAEKEQMEALLVQLHNNQKENKRIKVEMEKVAEDLENKKNERLVESKRLVEELNEAGLKLNKSEQELTVLKD